ncbi:MAG TPA: TIGR00282 family metallophosphoesterase [Terriglobales bacterium]|nr:TIGR00282 family metallophosphoesterase [Terriglobales bacterium]
MRILIIGDIFGRPGRHIVRDHLADIVAQRRIDLVVANAENAAAGFGLTPAIAEELLATGIEVLTTGNHIWDKKEIIEYLQSPNGSARRVLRPANYPAGTPGTGLYQGTTRGGVPYAVLNLQGRVFMGSNDDPFRTADALLKTVQAKVVLVDMHAEATSEKLAMGWYLDGRVTAVVGTHTHVPTADERVLPGGTAYLTDLGMTGPYDSIIGVQKEQVLQRFLSSMPARFEPATENVWLCAALIECDPASGRAASIERFVLKQQP